MIRSKEPFESIKKGDEIIYLDCEDVETQGRVRRRRSGTMVLVAPQYYEDETYPVTPETYVCVLRPDPLFETFMRVIKPSASRSSMEHTFNLVMGFLKSLESGDLETSLAAAVLHGDEAAARALVDKLLEKWR